MKKKFGFYPYPSSFTAGDIKIEPLPEIRDVISNVASANRITDDWFFPPLVREKLKVGIISPIKPKRTPLIYARRYQLPATHTLNHRGTKSSQRLDFIILCTGLLLGIRLLPEPWGHFQKTPVEKHKLIDLVVSDREVEKCIPLFDNFWASNKPHVRRMMFSAINIFQLASSYEYEYERFIFQYIALDTIYRLFVECGHISAKRQINHAERPRAICKKLQIALPKWAKKKRGKRKNALSEIRNNLFHEGSIGNRAIGFGGINVPGTLLSMEALNCRALLFLLGLRHSYVSSPVTTRQMHGLN